MHRRTYYRWIAKLTLWLGYLAFELAGWLARCSATATAARRTSNSTSITSTDTSPSVSDAAAHIQISAALAGWPAETADALIAAGVSAATADRLFADALSRPQ